MIQRRSFLASILAACAAPAYVKAGILMPVREIVTRRSGRVQLVSGDVLMEMYEGRWENMQIIEDRPLSDYLNNRAEDASAPGLLPLSAVSAIIAELRRHAINRTYAIDVHPGWERVLREAGFSPR